MDIISDIKSFLSFYGIQLTVTTIFILIELIPICAYKRQASQHQRALEEGKLMEDYKHLSNYYF